MYYRVSFQNSVVLVSDLDCAREVIPDYIVITCSRWVIYCVGSGYKAGKVVPHGAFSQLLIYG